jgi:hypothetical protein
MNQTTPFLLINGQSKYVYLPRDLRLSFPTPTIRNLYDIPSQDLTQIVDQGLGIRQPWGDTQMERRLTLEMELIQNNLALPYQGESISEVEQLIAQHLLNTSSSELSPLYLTQRFPPAPFQSFVYLIQDVNNEDNENNGNENFLFFLPGVISDNLEARHMNDLSIEEQRRIARVLGVNGPGDFEDELISIGAELEGSYTIYDVSEIYYEIIHNEEEQNGNGDEDERNPDDENIRQLQQPINISANGQISILNSPQSTLRQSLPTSHAFQTNLPPQQSNLPVLSSQPFQSQQQPVFPQQPIFPSQQLFQPQQAVFPSFQPQPVNFSQQSNLPVLSSQPIQPNLSRQPVNRPLPIYLLNGQRTYIYLPRELHLRITTPHVSRLMDLSVDDLITISRSLGLGLPVSGGIMSQLHYINAIRLYLTNNARTIPYDMDSIDQVERTIRQREGIPEPITPSQPPEHHYAHEVPLDLNLQRLLDASAQSAEQLRLAIEQRDQLFEQQQRRISEQLSLEQQRQVEESLRLANQTILRETNIGRRLATRQQDLTQEINERNSRRQREQINLASEQQRNRQQLELSEQRLRDREQQPVNFPQRQRLPVLTPMSGLIERQGQLIGQQSQLIDQEIVLGVSERLTRQQRAVSEELREVIQSILEEQDRLPQFPPLQGQTSIPQLQQPVRQIHNIFGTSGQNGTTRTLPGTGRTINLDLNK